MLVGMLADALQIFATGNQFGRREKGLRLESAHHEVRQFPKKNLIRG